MVSSRNPITAINNWGCLLEATDLNRLLQYLHGSVLGFCWRLSPFSVAESPAGGPPTA